MSATVVGDRGGLADWMWPGPPVDRHDAYRDDSGMSVTDRTRTRHPHRTQRNADCERIRIRLLGIDAPEAARDDGPSQCGADQATEALRRLISGRHHA